MFNRRFLEAFTIALPDGRYRVRPHGRWGRTYIVDRATLDRLLRLQQVCGWLALAAMAVVGMVIREWQLRPVVFLTAAVCMILLGLAIAGSWHILRGAERLAEEAGSADLAIAAGQVRAQRGRMPGLLYRALMTVCISLAILFTALFVALAFTETTPWLGFLGTAAFFAALAGMVRIAHKPR